MYNKADILLVAVSLFCEYGYRETTMREIAVALDMRESNLQEYVQNKEELLWEIISRAANLFLVQACSVPTNLPLPEQLRLLVYRHLDVLAQEPGYVALFSREWYNLQGEKLTSIMNMQHTYEGYFLRILEQGEKQGLFHIQNIPITCTYILAALHWLNPGVYSIRSLAKPQVVHQYWLLVWQTIGGSTLQS